MTRTQDVRRCSFSEDGKKLVTAHKNSIIRVWNLPLGLEDGILECSQSLSADGGWLGVHFMESDRKLMSHDRERICVWNVSSRVLLHSYAAHTGIPDNIVISNQSRHFFSVTSSHTEFDHPGLGLPGCTPVISVWTFDNIENGPTHKLVSHANAIVSLGMSPDGRTLASTALDGTVRLWHIPDAIRPHAAPVDGPGGIVDQAISSPDGAFIATWVSTNKTIQFWNRGTASPIHSTICTPPQLSTHSLLRFSADGQKIALRGDGETVTKAWNVRTGADAVSDTRDGFDWESDIRGEWQANDGWVQHKNKYVARFPVRGVVTGTSGGTAICEARGTKRLYFLLL